MNLYHSSNFIFRVWIQTQQEKEQTKRKVKEYLGISTEADVLEDKKFNQGFKKNNNKPTMKKNKKNSSYMSKNKNTFKKRKLD